LRLSQFVAYASRFPASMGHFPMQFDLFIILRDVSSEIRQNSTFANCTDLSTAFILLVKNIHRAAFHSNIIKNRKQWQSKISFIHSFHWQVQNATIPCRSQELLPFISVIYFSCQSSPPNENYYYYWTLSYYPLFMCFRLSVYLNICLMLRCCSYNFGLVDVLLAHK
jgi:hypothetical protein